MSSTLSKRGMALAACDRHHGANIAPPWAVQKVAAPEAVRVAR